MVNVMRFLFHAGQTWNIGNPSPASGTDSKSVSRNLRVGLALLLLLGVGCGGKGDVSGHVSYQGKTVTAGWVLIVAEDGLPHYGKIKADGAYFVSGVSTGEARVCVTGPDPYQNQAEGTRPKRMGRENPKSPNQRKSSGGLPDRYDNPLDSGLHCQVSRGKVIFDINLE